MTDEKTTAIAIRPEGGGGGGGTLATVAATPGAIEAIEKVGDWFHLSEMFGCKKPQQGRMLALACAITDRDPFELANQYMIVEGRLTRRYDMLLADLRSKGGDFDWIADGEDGTQATIEITWRGKTKRFSYTMEMAKRAGVVKNDSGWTKRPGNMLRSKAVRNGFQMICPEILGGVLTPEDAEDIAAEERVAKPTTAAPDRKKRQTELQQIDQPPVAESIAKQDDVIDVPFDTAPAPKGIEQVSAAQLRELKDLISPSNLNIPEATYESKIQEKFGCLPGDMTPDQADKVLAAFRATLAKKRAASTAAAS